MRVSGHYFVEAVNNAYERLVEVGAVTPTALSRALWGALSIPFLTLSLFI